MFEILKHAHSGWRWIVLGLLIYAIFNAFTKWQSGKSFEEKDRKVNLFTMVSAHIQFLFGIILYFLSDWVRFDETTMGNEVLRFFTVEHALMMFIAIALISIGNTMSKKATEDSVKFKKTFIFFLIALIVILVAIPWPFRGFGNAWF